MTRSLLLSISLFGLLVCNFQAAFAQTSEGEKAFEKLTNAHHKLAKKTQKKAQKYLRSGKKLEQRSQKLWSKWVRKFDFPENVRGEENLKGEWALEYLGSQIFYDQSWTLIQLKAIEMGGYKSYYDFLKKRRHSRVLCRMKKGFFFGLAGLSFAGGIAATVAVPLLAWPTVFGPYGLVYLGVPAGANWGTLALIQGLKGKCQ